MVRFRAPLPAKEVCLKMKKVLAFVLFFAATFFCTQKVSAASYNAISVDGLLLPYYGTTAIHACLFENNKGIYGGNYSLVPCTWETKNSDGQWQSMTGTGLEFQPGYEYRVKLAFKIREEGDDFAEDLSEVFVNGTRAEFNRFTVRNSEGLPTTALVYWYFTPLESTKLDTPDFDFHATGYNTGYFTHTTEFVSFGGEIMFSYNPDPSTMHMGSYESSFFDSTSPDLGTIYIINESQIPIRFLDSEMETITIDRFEKPSGVFAEKSRIRSVSGGLEYTDDISMGVDEANWAEIYNNESEWVAPGKYYVRKKASGSTYASEYIKVQVDEYVDPVDFGVINPETGDKIFWCAVILVLSVALLVALWSKWWVAWVVIYIGFLVIDLLCPNFLGTTIIKLAGILSCFIFVLKNTQKDKLLYIALGLTFIADVLLAINNVSAAGVAIFYLTQLTHLVRLTKWKIWDAAKYLTINALTVIVGLGLKMDLLLAMAAVYGITIISNIYASIKNYRQRRTRPALFALIGFVLFGLCDSCVALSYLSSIGIISAEFYIVVNYLAWVFYFPSQVFIANSSDYMVQ